MRRMRSWALATLLLAFAMPVMGETAAQVFKQVSPSVVVVVTYDAAGKPSELGSGVALPNGSVATNCHVLKDGAQYRVRYQDKNYPAQLRKSDWDRDICSLTVSGLHAPPVVLGDTTKLEVGAPVYAIGAPEGLQLTLSEGIVSSLRNVDGGSYIQTTAAISPGSSGGGLFDDQGRLLGLTSFFMSEGQQLNFALPVEWIEALPQRATQHMVQGTSEVNWLNRAAALHTTKDWNRLVALTESWTKAFPNSGDAWLALGEAYDKTGQIEKSNQAYRHGLQLNPQNEWAWYNLGNAYNRTSQHARAIEAYHDALQINPMHDDAWAGLGFAYDELGQYAQALDADHHALQINAQNEPAWYNLGTVYGHAGQYTQAIDAFRQALQLNGQDQKAWFNLGTAYTEAGQPSQAIEALRHALQINPQDEGAWVNLGAAYDTTEQHAQAIDALRQALQINPQDAKAWINLGNAYVKADQYTQAIEAERQALKIDPQLAQAWFTLGAAYVLTGQKDQAMEAYQHLRTLSPRLAKLLFDNIVPQ